MALFTLLPISTMTEKPWKQSDFDRNLPDNTPKKSKAGSWIMALSPVIVFFVWIIVSIVFRVIINASWEVPEMLNAIRAFVNRMLGLLGLISIPLCIIWIVRVAKREIDTRFDINNVPATRDELTEEQKDLISKKLLWRRIASIFVPSIALLWARKYNVFFIFLGISFVLWFISGILEIEGNVNSLLSLFFRIIYVRITIVHLPKRAYTTSKWLVKSYLVPSK